MSAIVGERIVHKSFPSITRHRLALYCGASGDHNPIHLHAWSAKAFGFPRAIAHGMWAKARCLAALRLPDAFETSVQFKKPILLPSRVTFGEAEDRYAVHSHLEGTLKRH